MTRFIIVRLLQSFVALIGISVLIFLLVRASGDPTMLYRTSMSTEEDIARIRANLGLDKPLPEQYWIFITDLAQGDLGESLLGQRRPVTEMIWERLDNSLLLAVPAFLLSMIVALLLGVLGAVKRDTWMDNGVKFVAILGQALPGFWLAIMCILLFSVYWQIFPPSHMGDFSHYVLPVSTMAFFLLPGMLRLVRSSMLDVLDSEYIKMARIKGLPERIVIWKHALRNALIAPLTAAGMILAMLVTGTVVTEQVFAWPGVGMLMLDALFSRDFPVVQGIVLMVAAMVLLVNLLVDILYAYIEPQIRYQQM
ncbi:MAG TPA: ABC transporter permease [Dehalococcoidia bacterium]|nr:ABC transporter permease [Dehalococcoidia bacterium]